MQQFCYTKQKWKTPQTFFDRYNEKSLLDAFVRSQ